MPEFSSVSDAVQALTTQWPQVKVTRTEDHILVMDESEILYDGPDWGLLFFVQALQGETVEEEEQDDPPSSRAQPLSGSGAAKRT